MAAIRAIRHPERYGPRARYGYGESGLQSRARGLTRAILDTFPVVKFGSSAPNTQSNGKDIESTDSGDNPALEMTHKTQHDQDTQKETGADKTTPVVAIARSAVAPESPEETSTSSPEASTSSNVATRRPPLDEARSSREDVVPAAIGRETCPICILDFEEGDDLRVLPCEGKHRFHQQCVDPWLLELSSSCPICRHGMCFIGMTGMSSHRFVADFLALENMLSGEGPEDSDMEEDSPPQPRAVRTSNPRRSSRFSRYVRSAIQRRRHRRSQHDNVPPVPDVDNNA
ncbi:hypothetical protein PQX77_018826 [Marasmius sp. AFHP31]|nr:hypothetical protein PQX77_018826 [Marasmius sp. AFHP31]